MTLVLEIEYLSGVSFAAIGPDSDTPDWPPQPDRVFSALVASWAARGQNAEEAAALRWLESLPAPQMHASQAESRTAPVVFVPPNDSRSDRQKNAKGLLPALRNRQPRRFPAARPLTPILHLYWLEAKPEQKTVEALQQLASDTSYIGHSASLTRCRFLYVDNNKPAPDDAEHPRRRIYLGRLDELCRDFKLERRPLPGPPVSETSREIEYASAVFDTHWLILEHIAGEMPDVRACAIVSKTIRDTLLSGYRQIGCGDQIPEVVSGHTIEESPSQQPHLAIVPLLFAGFPHADGHVMAFALVPPRSQTILEDDTFRRALRKLAPVDERRGRRVLTVKTREGTPRTQAFRIDLSPTFDPPPGKRSLDPSLYLGPSRTWATLTPIVLDRHLKRTGEARQEEVEQQIAAACSNIGLPDPEGVVVDKHCALEGAVSAYASGASPPWMSWRLPAFLASRQLTHAVVRFSEPIQGPVILGAGRYLGLGLCRPSTRERI